MSTDDQDDENIPERLAPEEFRIRVMALVQDWFSRPEKSITLAVDYDYNRERITLHCTRRDDGTYESSSSMTCWARFHDGPKAARVAMTDQHLVVHLDDERVLMIPLSWYPKLFHATPEQRERWRLIAGGLGICWDEIDEDLSIRGLFAESASPAPVPKALRR